MFGSEHTRIIVCTGKWCRRQSVFVLRGCCLCRSKGFNSPADGFHFALGAEVGMWPCRTGRYAHDQMARLQFALQKVHIELCAEVGMWPFGPEGRITTKWQLQVVAEFSGQLRCTRIKFLMQS